MRAGGVLAVGLLAGVAGCGRFFIAQGTGGGGNSTSGNVVYVTNTTPSEIVAYTVSTSGGLSAVTGSPYALTSQPVSIAVTPGNTFLYVGVQGGIYVYTIGTGGVLTAADSGNPVASSLQPVSMQVDSTGKWLLVADSSAQKLNVYSINSSTGILTAASTPSVGLTNANGGLPNNLTITPDNSYVFVSLGAGGVDGFPFNSSDGSLGTRSNLKPKTTNQSSDNWVRSDGNSKYLFVAESGTGGGLRVLTIGTTNLLTEISGSPFATGLGPSSVALDSTSTYVYVTNRTDGTISGFTLGTGGALTALAASPFTSGTAPVAMTLDQSKEFLAVISAGTATAGGDPDLQTFSFSAATPGKLLAASTTTTGTDPTNPTAVTSTH